ncbi:hypothetical protein K5M73_07190 [Streptomonospora halotolerans]|nr:hypothetical protein [Streptomonospora nanhaiensis]
MLGLLFGVGAMHTLGHHPEHAHGTPPPPAAAAHADPATAHDGTDPPALDPTSVCLAIGGIALALIGVAAALFTPWPRVPVGPPPAMRWRLTAVALPAPPSLAKLQVLRI